MSDNNNNNDNSDDNRHNFCFLQVSIAGKSPQKIIIQLHRSICPITCSNFATLCSTPGRTTRQNPIPTYRGSIIHRIVPQFMIQGGDFENFSGCGGYCVCTNANTATFDDENFILKHDKAGVVSMANKGKNTNGSQFFITLQATPHLNSKHVVFGQVIQGMDVLYAMTTEVELEQGTARPGAMQKIVIVDCGLGKGNDSNSDDVQSIGSFSSNNENVKKRRKRIDDDKHRQNRKRRKRKEESKDKHKKKKKRKRKSPGDREKTKKEHRDHRGADDNDNSRVKEDAAGSYSSDSSSSISSSSSSKRRERKNKHKKEENKKERRRKHSSSSRSKPRSRSSRRRGKERKDEDVRSTSSFSSTSSKHSTKKNRS